MPVLPVSDFWHNSFIKYYKLRWVIHEDIFVDANKSLKKANNSQCTEVTNMANDDDEKHPRFKACLAKYNIPFIVITSLFIFMIVLLFPLSLNISFSSHDKLLDSHLYVTYQTIYTILAYPCTVCIFYAALPTTFQNNFYRYIMIPIPILLITTSVYILYSPIAPAVKAKTQYAASILGVLVQFGYAAVVFLIVVYSKSCHRWLFTKLKPVHGKGRTTTNTTGHYTHIGAHYRQNFSKTPRVSISFSMTPTTKYSTFTQAPDTINSAILFQNSELSESSNFGEKTISYVDNEQLQAIACVFTVGGMTAAYYWTNYFTLELKTQNSIPKTLFDEINSIIILYPAFWIIINVIKFFTARFARVCDSNKTSVYSLEIIITVFLMCFYYIFYRNLFLYVNTVREFVFVETLHITLELVNIFRMSWWYFDNTRKLQQTFNDSKTCCSKALWPIVWILYDPSEYHIWCVRICIGYTIKCVVCIGSFISYIVGVLWMRYGYNQCFYDIKDIDKIQFERSLRFICIGAGVEFIMFFFIDKIMTHVYKIDAIKHWKVLIKHRQGYIWYIIFMLQHVQTDCVMAKLLI